MSDPRDKFFAPVASARIIVRVIAEEPGIVAGSSAVAASLAEIGMATKSQLADGAPVKAGTVVTEIVVSPKEIALAEERLIGLMAKPCGIGTARFVARAGVEVAFAGGVQLGDIEALADIGVDVVDIGRPIVDAPLLDMWLDVIEVQS